MKGNRSSWRMIFFDSDLPKATSVFKCRQDGTVLGSTLQGAVLLLWSQHRFGIIYSLNVRLVNFIERIPALGFDFGELLLEAGEQLLALGLVQVLRLQELVDGGGERVVDGEAGVVDDAREILAEHLGIVLAALGVLG